MEKHEADGKRERPAVIGVTGGVGSGKSVILKILEEKYGAEIILADEVAHELMEPGQPAYGEICRALGDGFLKEDGSIDRAAFSALLFSDGSVREQVDSLVHPLVWEEVRRRIADAGRRKIPLVVVEAALPDEKVHDIYDEMWYVYTSRENRIRRLMEGRGYTREKCESIMASQLSDEEFRRLCRFEIDNNGSLSQTERQIEERWKDRGRKA